VNPWIVGSTMIPPKIENSNLYGFELHRPSIKSTAVLFEVIKVIIIIMSLDSCLSPFLLLFFCVCVCLFV